MKCEIITIYSLNYGNRLQNYALQETLKKLGLKVCTNRNTGNIKLKRIKELIKSLRHKHVADYFSYFDTNNITFKYSQKECKDAKSVDFYIAGSDQIWNPLFQFNSDREFLTFTSADKKIAYAASIGITELSDVQKKRFINNLSDFHAISVRESSAADMICDLVGKRPSVVLDPTMLLTEEEWEKIGEQSRIKIDEPFIVKYFLGIRNSNIEQKIELFAQQSGYKIIDITDEKISSIIGPAEYVHLFQKSKMNFVDSFHGTVFSIIFNKPFYTFSRPNENGYGDMNSRFESIFSLFQINDRYIDDLADIKFLEQMNYEKVNKILENERLKSINFLKNAMNLSQSDINLKSQNVNMEKQYVKD